MKETLTSVASTITDKSFTITIDVLPTSRWHRWAQSKKILDWLFPAKKMFTIRGLTYGTLERMSALILQIDHKIAPGASYLEKNYELMAKHSRTITEIVALAIHNRKDNPPESLTNFLMYNMSAEDSLSVFYVLVKAMDMKSFWSTIVLMRGLNVKESVLSDSAESRESQHSKTSPQVPGNSLET